MYVKQRKSWRMSFDKGWRMSRSFSNLCHFTYVTVPSFASPTSQALHLTLPLTIYFKLSLPAKYHLIFPSVNLTVHLETGVDFGVIQKDLNCIQQERVKLQEFKEYCFIVFSQVCPKL